MLWSRTLIPTLREDPQDAEIRSHKLMLRGGLIRRLGGGLYTFLPLGLRSLRKLERIVREEMARAGAIEVLMPALQPRDLWDRSGRYEQMTDVMFRVRDHQERELVLGPTHEEVITDLAAREISSYRQLPRTFYQIQTKFRDEIRPRFGLMRAREFIMKDAYSFDADWDAADRSYEAMYEAYTRIFRRCGLRTTVVEADTGAMGGKWSHEFMVVADAGEDGLVECTSCGYAANTERAERAVHEAAVFPGAEEQAELVDTPRARTIGEVSAFLSCKPRQLLKTLIYLADDKPVAAVVAGDREVNEHKLRRAIEAARIELADNALIESVTGAPTGFAGPVGLDIPVYADIALQGCRGAITGANRDQTHRLHVDLARDAEVAGYHDLTIVGEGDACPRCPGMLSEKRGIEVGHVFKLGTKYSRDLGAEYLDESGRQTPLVMGCYGIGVTRTLQAVIEQGCDEGGIVWPPAIAPYQAVIVLVNPGHEHSERVAGQLHDALEEAGVDTLLDDRDERAGVKFKDADLVGIPVRVVVGERSLAKGGVEIKRRASKDMNIVAEREAVRAIRQALGAET